MPSHITFGLATQNSRFAALDQLPPENISQTTHEAECSSGGEEQEPVTSLTFQVFKGKKLSKRTKFYTKEQKTFNGITIGRIASVLQLSVQLMSAERS